MIIFAKIRISIDYKDFITQNVQPANISDSGVEKIIRNLRKEGDIRRKGGRFGGEWEVLK